MRGSISGLFSVLYGKLANLNHGLKWLESTGVVVFNQCLLVAFGGGCFWVAQRFTAAIGLTFDLGFSP
jgi:hypothetical protein